jgi:hypothetical protein
MNSTGTVFSRMFRPINALYAKVIICSLTVSHTTSIIDGLNRPVNRSDELPEPKGHAWATRQPLPSRSLPCEDSFSALMEPLRDWWSSARACTMWSLMRHTL